MSTTKVRTRPPVVIGTRVFSGDTLYILEAGELVVGLETGALLYRIHKLTVAIGQLDAVHIQLKTLANPMPIDLGYPR